MTGLLFFFSALGAFNGLILCSYLFFFTKEKTLPKYLLSGLILALSIRIGKSVFLYFDPSLPKIYLQIGLSACFFIGPFLFFYLKSVLDQQKKLPQNWKFTFLALLAIVLTVGSIRPYQQYPDFWNHVFAFIIYYQWLFFILASGYLMRNSIKKLFQKGQTVPANEKWLLAIFTANLIIFANYFVVLHGFSALYYIAGPLIFSFFLYLAVFGYFYKDANEFSQQKPISKYANKKIDPEEAQALIQQLNHLMTQEKMYINSKLKLKAVAEKLSISTHHLSQLLNDNLGKSFATYINEYRIQAACELLGTDHRLSLEGIGYEVGFSSKSNFFITFKKIKGITPAQFQQQLTA